jgi:hypothetical protein
MRIGSLQETSGARAVKRRPMPRTFPLPSIASAPPRALAPISFGRDGRLGELRGNDFIVRQADDFTALTHVPLGNPAGIGALSDGSLVALDATDAMGRASLLIRVAPGTRRPTLHDGLIPETGVLRICAGLDASELACTQPGSDRVYRLKLLEGRLELIAAARVRGERTGIMTSLADGSIVYASGPRELVRAAFGTLPRRYAVAIEPRALLPGPAPELLWLCGGDELLLVSLAEPLRPLVRRPIPHDQLDIAAGGRHLAMLQRDRRGSLLVCFDERALERWRVPVGLGEKWLACSARQVAVAGDGDLAVYDAASGALLHAS